jgi:hypothetical protein
MPGHFRFQQRSTLNHGGYGKRLNCGNCSTENCRRERQERTARENCNCKKSGGQVFNFERAQLLATEARRKAKSLG